MRVEHEYERCGAWAYMAALDVHRAKVFGRCEPKSGIAPFERLVEHVMRQPPYNEARRVFWIMDNGSSHRGAKCVARLQEKYARLVPVHGSVHASWLNQIEIYFAIVQRKALTPQRLPVVGRRRTATARFPNALRNDRPPLRVEIHSPRPCRITQKNQITLGSPTTPRSMINKYVRELMNRTT